MKNEIDPVNSPNGLVAMKWHGLGNDFVLLDSRGRPPVVTPDLARGIGHRNFGIGFDQLAEIRDGVDGADICLDFWNSDGSRAGACGNATRCVGRYIMDDLGLDAITIRTTRGLLFAQRLGELVSVNMGPPVLDWDQVPVARDLDLTHLPLAGDPVGVGMGNPHCVFFVDDIAAVDVAARGAVVEVDPLFPAATNVEFAQVLDAQTIRMRVWERGAGITLACGSGACATVVAAVQRGLTDRRVQMIVDGGTLELDWRDDGVWMTGPTAHVADLTLTPAFLAGLGAA